MTSRDAIMQALNILHDAGIRARIVQAASNGEITAAISLPDVTVIRVHGDGEDTVYGVVEVPGA